jgi:hypothetical protein
MKAFFVVHIIYWALLLTCFVPSTAATATLNNNNAEYLALLGQKGTQIIADIVRREEVSRNAGNQPDVVLLLTLEKLRNDVRLMTLEGDHLQSVIAIARRMGDRPIRRPCCCS